MLGGRKQDDGKEEAQRKKEVTYHVNSLMLNNNQIREITYLYDTLKNYVLYDVDKLQWLNLSYNYLTKIQDEILNFVNLKTLQM